MAATLPTAVAASHDADGIARMLGRPRLPRRTPVGTFGRRAVASVQRRTGTTPPAPDRTGFYAAVDPGPGRRGEVLGDRAARRRRRRARLAGPLPHARRRRPTGRRVDGVGDPRRHRGGPAPGRRVGARRRSASPPGCGPSRTGLEPGTPPSCCAPAPSSSRPTSPGSAWRAPCTRTCTARRPGASVLDAARAAADLTTAGAGNVVAIAGHSAGGFAVLWANELAAGADGDGPRRPPRRADVAGRRPRRGDGPLRDDPRARPPSPCSSPATWPGVEDVDAGGVLTPAAIAPPRPPLRADRLGRPRAGVPWRPGAGGSAPTAFADGAWAAALERQSAGPRARRRAGRARPRRRRRGRARSAGRSRSPPSCPAPSCSRTQAPTTCPSTTPPAATSSTGSSPRCADADATADESRRHRPSRPA